VEPVKVLRTPDSRFEDLAGYPFAPRYLTIPDLENGTLRIHFVDEGHATAPAILLLHGNPTWSYSYRRVIPILSEAGFRVVAPDLVGLGRSDKPAEPSDYSYSRHLEWLRLTIEALDLSNATLVGQDWGGIMSLCLLDEIAPQFDRILVSNTGLYRPGLAGEKSEAAAAAWFEICSSAEPLPIGPAIASQSLRGLTDQEIAGYEAPFPTEPYKAGARAFASLIPSLLHAEETRAASLKGWAQLARWEKPFQVAFSDQDFMTAPFAEPLRSGAPGAKGQPQVTIQDAKHYVQDDAPHALASEILAFIERTA
jgi:haloalkane dehalogenase